MSENEHVKKVSTHSEVNDEEYNIGELLRSYWRGQLGKAQLMVAIENRVDRLVPKEKMP